MRTPARFLGVLTGITLVLGGAALIAPAAQADIPACTNMVQQTGVTVSDTVTAACTKGVHNDLRGCVTALTEAGVPGGAATGACRMAANPP
ncbi:hypothetical protein JK361_30050 [Streptomyces sp. 5-8]|uniref:Uncharacterized protein n=1 Tax=Streptomyces musisoli TaxID=2802280 RepID=A0ABS1P8Y0_9ACTN|nr:MULTISPECIES: hypothetical protein [Streptomyces]MBL1108778.1 hypothetical protein [Streptomyces musisoli]MBY8842905.1 hypothetical protein [Streptomyces sp. SP2-10]